MESSSQTLKIALIGYGKMGKMVEKVAISRHHQIVELADADVCIEFTHPDAALSNIQKALELNKKIVVGTTGWDDKLDQVKTLVEKHKGSLLYSANFSLGVNLFLQVVEQAAKRYLAYPEYDVAGTEWHHNQKVDAPSGTALSIEKKVGRKNIFSSVRCGTIPGTHQVQFDSAADLITLTHEARSKEGFALGAVKAAEWLHNKTGLYTMEDIFS